MKRFLVFLFSVSITLQSIVGQFVFCNLSTNTYFISTPFFLSNNKQTYSHGSLTAEGSVKQILCSTLQGYTDKSDRPPEFERDSVTDHLFSLYNFPNKAATALVFSFLFLGNCFDLLVIEEKLNNFAHFYSTLYKNIMIGLSSTKLIYPYHNFY